MKAIVNTAPYRLEMLEVPLPQPGPGQARIRTGACAICATDLKMIAGWSRTGFLSIPGHEWAGTIDAVGEGGNPSLIGHKCVAENVLSDGKEVGFEHPGGYGEYFITEAAKIQRLPDDYDLAVATLIEPLAVAVRAVRRLRSDAVAPILIFGDGAIGLLMVQMLVRAGHKQIVVVGGRASRLALATGFGASRTLNYHEVGDDLALAIRQENGEDFPTVVEASGSPAAMSTALAILRPSGRILVLGDYGEERADFRWNLLMEREIEMIASNASAGAWPEAVRLAAEGALPLAALVTRRLPVDRFQEGFALMQDRRANIVKIVLEW